MTERPIIFSTESVRAILDGRKTQTRRAVKPQPVLRNRLWEWHTGRWSNGCNPVFLPGHGMYNRMPYKPGDRLWVREAWQKFVPDEISYRADRSIYDTNRWCSPLFMPRKFSRLTLKITDVRCERLCTILPEDVRAEGYDWSDRSFIEAWDKLNAKRGFGWDTNPWVWVIEFKRVETLFERKENE